MTRSTGSNQGDHSLQSPDDSLIHRAMRGGLWVVGGHVLSQGLRLGSNLILTRMLFPEAFGLMALVHLVLLGVALFSDVGLGASVVQDPRGDDRDFLNTVWTLQVIRGFILAIVVAILAAPMASFYEMPELFPLIAVVGLTGIVNGFASTSLGSLTRRVQPSRAVFLELISQAFSIVVMMTWAALHPTVWALAAGAFARVLLLSILSHWAIPGYRNRFRWEPEAIRSIVRFGRWILMSTAFTFLITHGDRLVLGKLMSAGELGVYTIAFFPAQLVVMTVGLLAQRVLFPVYARLSSGDPATLKRETARIRGFLMLLMLPPLWGLVLGGPQLVSLLYDTRYDEAGWMLQILAVGAIGQVVTLTAESIALARGNSFQHMLLQASYASLLFICMAIGGSSNGVAGLLVGMATARILSYFPLIPLMRSHNVWLPSLDATAFAVSAIAIGGGLFLLGQY